MPEPSAAWALAEVERRIRALDYHVNGGTVLCVLADVSEAVVAQTTPYPPAGPEPTHRERLLADAIVKISLAAGVAEEALSTRMTGPMVLDLAEQTRGWVAQMYAQSEVGQEEHRHDRLSTNRSLRPLMTLEDAQRIVRQHEDEQDDGEPVDTAFRPGNSKAGSNLEQVGGDF